MKKKVIIGMSGGVDSAVSAILLLKQGYDVEGMFMRNWDSFINNDVLGNPNDINDICPQEQDYMDALKTCEDLGIPLHRVDFVQEYWDNVFSYFLNEYKACRTPNPDILCNKEIKFKCFVDEAFKLGCDYIAMGHYARISHKDGVHRLLKGKDSNKDQTYFLSKLSQEQISKALFPIGELLKSEVRKIAIDNNINVAKKKDSTGVCFIGERRFQEFLKNYLPAKEGNMVTIDGQIMGVHDGIMYYTIGQRHGLKIGGKGDAWYVVGKRVDTNELIVGQGDKNPLLFSNNCIIDRLNILDRNLKERLENNEVIECMAKFRYRQQDNPVVIQKIDDDKIKVEYKQMVKAVTPGQECVFYDGDYLIGSGSINTVYMDDIRREY